MELEDMSKLFDKIWFLIILRDSAYKSRTKIYKSMQVGIANIQMSVIRLIWKNISDLTWLLLL